MALAFSMYPTSIEELMNIADADLLMPPKSTWFEPKLRSGLFIHNSLLIVIKIPVPIMVPGFLVF